MSPQVINEIYRNTVRRKVLVIYTVLWYVHTLVGIYCIPRPGNRDAKTGGNSIPKSCLLLPFPSLYSFVGSPDQLVDKEGLLTSCRHINCLRLCQGFGSRGIKKAYGMASSSKTSKPLDFPQAVPSRSFYQAHVLWGDGDCNAKPPLSATGGTGQRRCRCSVFSMPQAPRPH